MRTLALHPEHLVDLRKSGLTDETIGAAGIYTVRPEDIRKKLGYDTGIDSLMAFPYPAFDGFERYKVFREAKGDPKAPKYLQKSGTPNHLYFPPTVDLQGDAPLVLTEGEKKTLALWQAGYQVTGIGGVFNWLTKGKDDDSRPITDFDMVNWKRPVTILFDSDGPDNPMVRLAAFRLARELARRGAQVSILFLTPGPAGEKAGADDFLISNGPEALGDLLKTAWTFNPAWEDREAEVWWQVRDLTPDTPKTDTFKRLAALAPNLARLTHLEAEVAIDDLAHCLNLPDKFFAALRQDVKKARKDCKPAQRKEGNGQPAYSAMLPNLVELVEHDGTPAFLMKIDGHLAIMAEVEHEGTVYSPPPKDQIPWLLPRGVEVLKIFKRHEPEGALYDDLLAYHKNISELPSESYYDLIAAWVLHTYLLEACQYSPVICNFAVPERGKTRTGKAMIYLARRGLHVESLRDAYLVRMAHHFQAAIFFDVMNLWKKAEKAGSEDILLHRYERGAKVPRVLYPERGAHRDTIYYEIFGPTIIATNISVHNILDTRAVQVNMPQTSRRFENDVTPEKALPLKERLTAFRAHHLGKSLPSIPKPAAGRLGDILKPLLQIIQLVRPERETLFLDLVKELEKGRLIDKADSLDAQILIILNSLKGQVHKSILPVKVITDTFNEGKPETSHITYQRMGRKLAALGFGKGKTADGASAVIWDEQKFLNVFSAYGLGKTSVIPETSVMPEDPAPKPDAESPQPDIADHTGITDVLPGVHDGEKNYHLMNRILGGQEVEL